MSNEKFKALVHFIAHECQDNPNQLGAIKLNKVLWYTDMIAYQMNGSSVTGARYIKREFGPVPEAILSTLDELVEEKNLLIKHPEHRYDSRKYITLAPPDLSILSHDERDLARQMINFVCGHTATEISEKTHEEVWSAALEGEELPLFATLASGSGQITNEARVWANTIIDNIETDIAA